MRLPEILYEESADQGVRPDDSIDSTLSHQASRAFEDKALREGPFIVNIAGRPGSEKFVTLNSLGVSLEDLAKKVPGVTNLIALVKFLTGQAE